MRRFSGVVPSRASAVVAVAMSAPCDLCRNGLAQLAQALLGTLARGVERRVGLAVQRLARLEDLGQVLHRLGMALHRTKVALRNDARHVLAGCCLHPNGQAILQEQIEGLRLGDEAATDRHHHFRMRLERATETPTFDPPVTGLSVEQKDFRQADSRFALDLAIELDERNAPILGERRAQGRLARAAQSDQRDAFLARCLLEAEFAHQAEDDVLEAMLGQSVQEAPYQSLFDGVLARLDELAQLDTERARDAAQQKYRCVALARFEL